MFDHNHLLIIFKILHWGGGVVEFYYITCLNSCMVFRTFLPNIWFSINCIGARGVIVIVAGNEHGDKSSNTGRD